VRLALAGVALGASLALTACGSVSLDPVARAADKTVNQGSGHVTLTASIGSGAEVVQLSGDGDFQTKPALGAMTMTVRGSGIDSTMDEVLSGSTIYMRSPLFASALPAGKSWLSVDLQRFGKRFGIDFNQLAQQSPADALESLKKNASVTKVGAETIDGTPTTHYRALVDVSRLSPKLQQATDLKTLPVDVWIDDSGLVRRLSESYTVSESGRSLPTTLRMLFSNYGEPVDVQVPSADETLDMTKLGG
jgi:hypothetical protein